MSLFHRHHSQHRGDKSTDVGKDLAGAGYDAQADIALPTGRSAVEAGDVILFGMDNFIEPLSGPAYDIDRDTAS